MARENDISREWNEAAVSRLVEPKLTAKAVSKHPSLRKRLRIPQSIIIEAIKT